MRIVGNLAIVVALVGTLSCGQEDPTFSPRGQAARIGSLIVDASIAGAEVSIDGVPTGQTTPAQFDDVLAGSHSVSVFLPGYVIAVEQVDIVADEESEIFFELDLIQEPGSIQVSLNTAWDVAPAILVDGTATGLRAPATVTGIQAGERMVTLSAPGFAPEPAAIAVTVLADLTVDAAFGLTVPKLVVCEDFSNYACAPCPAADEALHEVIETSMDRRVISINPHASWPGRGDPFYQCNPDMLESRRAAYGVVQLPTILVDGRPVTDPLDRDAIRQRVRDTPSTPPVAVGVVGALAGDSYDIQVDVWGVGEQIPSGLRLYTCIVEREVTLTEDAPNGQQHYVNVLREVLPPVDGRGNTGMPLSLATGGHETISLSYPIATTCAIDPNELAVIAFVQDTSDLEILQAGTNVPQP